MGRIRGNAGRGDSHIYKSIYGNAIAACVIIVGSDGKPYTTVGAADRTTTRKESYFYADFYAEGSFEVNLPPGRARMNVSGGIETIPQLVTVDADAAAELTMHLQPWIDQMLRVVAASNRYASVEDRGKVLFRRDQTEFRKLADSN